jgi:hypothetical protein
MHANFLTSDLENARSRFWIGVHSRLFAIEPPGETTGAVRQDEQDSRIPHPAEESRRSRFLEMSSSASQAIATRGARIARNKLLTPKP